MRVSVRLACNVQVLRSMCEIWQLKLSYNLRPESPLEIFVYVDHLMHFEPFLPTLAMVSSVCAWDSWNTVGRP